MTMSPPRRDDAGTFSPAPRAHGEMPPTQIISVFGILNVLLRHRRLIVLMPLVAAIVTVFVSWLLPDQYTVTASFLPSSSTTDLSGIASIAAQFGVSVPGASTTSGEDTPQFYQILLTSPVVLEPLVQQKWSFVQDGDTVKDQTLIDLYEVDESTRGKSIRKTEEKVSDDISISVDATTGLVTMSYVSKWGPLSTMVVQRMLDMVNTFNMLSQQEQARLERDFIKSRLDSARIELSNAEDDLEQFTNRNRSYRNDPMLSLTFDRLSREVSMRSQVLTSLSQAYEQGRISAVRNTPAIELVQRPELPIAPDKKKLLLKGVLALIGGWLLAVVIAFARDVARSGAAADTQDYHGFVGLWNDTMDDVSRFVPVWRKRRLRRQSL